MLINLPKITDPRGSLTAIESGLQVPFEIKRIYYLYELSGDKPRGHHAHKELRQLMIAVAGQFDVLLDDGSSKTEYHLNRPDKGLVIDKLIWHEMYNFSPNAVCIVLASAAYDESDYFRDYDSFLKVVNANQPRL
jgi:hypothetical protein